MMLVLVLLAAAVLLAFREYHARTWARGADAALSFEQPFVYAGETVQFTEVVSNRGRMPLPELEVRFRIPQGPVFQDAENVIVSDHVYKRDIFALRPMERVTRRYTLLCPRRGQFPVSDLTLRARSLFHRREYELSLETGAGLSVYAAQTDVSGILARCDALLGSQESRRRTLEDPYAWAGIRAYTPQDPMRVINWKAAARAGELMVNTYASVQTEEFCIYLDARDDRILKQEDLVEYGISVAASLCRRLIGRGQAAGLYVYADREVLLPPARGQAQLTAMEQALTEDLTGWLGRKAGTSGSTSHGSIESTPRGTSGEKGPSAIGRDFPEWACRRSAEDRASQRICIYISKEEETLQALQDLLTSSRNRSGNMSAPAILVQTVQEDGVHRLRTRLLQGLS